jgi:hypothetical protein
MFVGNYLWSFIKKKKKKNNEEIIYDHIHHLVSGILENYYVYFASLKCVLYENSLPPNQIGGIFVQSIHSTGELF